MAPCKKVARPLRRHAFDAPSGFRVGRCRGHDGAMRRLIVPVALIAAIVLAAATHAANADPKPMVLTLTDLPQGFAVDKAYSADTKRAAKESAVPELADFVKWGRVTGFDRDFARNATTGILFVSSDASTYTKSAGAAASLHDSFQIDGRTETFNGSPVTFRRVPMGHVGNEARMFTTRVVTQGVPAVFYGVIWRSGSVVASVLIGGVEGSVKPAQAEQLARKQQGRIHRVTG